MSTELQRPPNVMDAFDSTDANQYELLREIEGIVIQRIRTDRGVVLDRFTGGDTAYEFMKAVIGESVLGSSQPLRLGDTFATDVLHRIVLDDTMLQVVSYTFIQPDANPMVPVLLETGEYVVLNTFTHPIHDTHMVREYYRSEHPSDVLAAMLFLFEHEWAAINAITIIHPGGNEPYFNNG